MAISLNLNRKIVLIAINIRSAHNVGSLFRTAEGLGIKELVLTGYTPYPKMTYDSRLSYIIEKIDHAIEKTALGSQQSLKWSQSDDYLKVINKYKRSGYVILGLEQTRSSKNLLDVQSAVNIAIIVGNEVTGLDKSVIDLCDQVIEIPMLGKKESFNVVQAAAMAMFKFRYY